MTERAKWFRNLERQHQQTITFLHAAQRGEVSLDGLEEETISATIRAARRDLRYSRNLAVMRGDIPSYPKVQQMKKGVLVIEWVMLDQTALGTEHRNGYTNGNGHQTTEDLSQYTSTASAARTKTLAASLS